MHPLIALAAALLALPALLGLLRLALPGAPAHPRLRRALRTLATTRAGRRGAALLGGVGILGYVGNRVDPWFTAQAARLHGVADFSVWIHALEGGLTRHLQAFAPAPAIALFLAVYVSLFPALYAATLVALRELGRPRLVRAGALALALDYLLALPWFALVPVRETWHSQVAPAGAKARLLLADLHPALEPAFRDLRGIENNFPSLHTAVSVTAVLLAVRSGSPRLAAVTGAGAALVVFSTLYLGFHWIADAVAGALHALLCTALALWLVRRAEGSRLAAAERRSGAPG